MKQKFIPPSCRGRWGGKSRLNCGGLSAGRTMLNRRLRAIKGEIKVGCHAVLD